MQETQYMANEYSVNGNSDSTLTVHTKNMLPDYQPKADSQMRGGNYCTQLLIEPIFADFFAGKY